MADIQYPLINGNHYDFSSIEFGINGKRRLLVKSINYGHKLTPGEIPGASAQMLGSTRGKYEPNGSIEFWLAAWNEIVLELGDGYLEKRFDIIVNYAETGLPIITDTLRGVKLMGSDKQGTAGSEEGIFVSCDLHIKYVLENGKKPFVGLRVG